MDMPPPPPYDLQQQIISDSLRGINHNNFGLHLVNNVYAISKDLQFRPPWNVSFGIYIEGSDGMIVYVDRLWDMQTSRGKKVQDIVGKLKKLREELVERALFKKDDADSTDSYHPTNCVRRRMDAVRNILQIAPNVVSEISKLYEIPDMSLSLSDEEQKSIEAKLQERLYKHLILHSTELGELTGNLLQQKSAPTVQPAVQETPRKPQIEIRFDVVQDLERIEKILAVYDGHLLNIKSRSYADFHSVLESLVPALELAGAKAVGNGENVLTDCRGAKRMIEIIEDKNGGVSTEMGNFLKTGYASARDWLAESKQELRTRLTQKYQVAPTT